MNKPIVLLLVCVLAVLSDAQCTIATKTITLPSNSAGATTLKATIPTNVKVQTVSGSAWKVVVNQNTANLNIGSSYSNGVITLSVTAKSGTNGAFSSASSPFVLILSFLSCLFLMRTNIDARFLLLILGLSFIPFVFSGTVDCVNGTIVVTVPSGKIVVVNDVNVAGCSDSTGYYNKTICKNCVLGIGTQCFGSGGSAAAPCAAASNGCCSTGCCASGQCGGTSADNQYWQGCRAAGSTGSTFSTNVCAATYSGGSGTTTTAPPATTSTTPTGGAAGVTTRYWDCCKPSCSWSGKASVSSPVKECTAWNNGAGNQTIPSSNNAQSGCNGGTSFTCTTQQPWAIDANTAYGFAAAYISGSTESNWCCACYQLTFASGTAVAGKKFIVQVTNTGGDLGNNHFDLMIPGGGMGLFTAGCPAQFGSWNGGAQYGGLTSRDQCAQLPAPVQAGCLWRFDWFQNADNPGMNFVRVRCPAAITQKTGCTRNDDANYPSV